MQNGENKDITYKGVYNFEDESDAVKIKQLLEKNDIPVGFFTYKLDKKLWEFTGVRGLGRGIAAALPENKGAIVGLTIGALREGRVTQNDVGIFETLIWNRSAIKIWQRFGMDFVCSKYTLHKWLDK